MHWLQKYARFECIVTIRPVAKGMWLYNTISVTTHSFVARAKVLHLLF